VANGYSPAILALAAGLRALPDYAVEAPSSAAASQVRRSLGRITLARTSHPRS